MKNKSKKNSNNKLQTPSEVWREFIQAQLAANSNLGKAFEKAVFISFEQKTLSLVFEDESLIKKAKGQIGRLRTKLSLQFDRVDITQGVAAKVQNVPPMNTKQLNPLQSLNFTEFYVDEDGKEFVKPILEKAVSADANCREIYQKLTKRTEKLVGKKGETFSVTFNWRLRVGGTVGFRELLLPVFHPVFGIPFIPASTLKGAARAWARRNKERKINDLLGFLEGDNAQAAKVEILDAFPKQPSLSADVVTPQWSWNGTEVRYKPDPHSLLTMAEPRILIGLRPTSRGTKADVQAVKRWLEEALKTGIGSRVSSGYGRTLGQNPYFSHSKSFEFEFYTQGTYGIEPPTKENNYQGKIEFRPTEIRGILRYWFRAFALAYYSPEEAKELEENLFGDLSKPGKVGISAIINRSNDRRSPYHYSGKIYLEAEGAAILKLLEQLLILASHIGGFGRGARRPLHLLNGRMRGCYWEINSQNLPLNYDRQSWQNLFASIKNCFDQIKFPLKSKQSSPGNSTQRKQDVFDRNAQVWLVRSPNLKMPKQVKDWKQEGDKPSVLGEALELIYGDKKFKGEGREKNSGNVNVGGKLGIPSFFWLSSVFPYLNNPYQVVTIFGADHGDRRALGQALKNLGALSVY